MIKYKLTLISDPKNFPIDISGDPIFSAEYDTKEELQVGVNDFLLSIVEKLLTSGKQNEYSSYSVADHSLCNRYSIWLYNYNDRNTLTNGGFAVFEIKEIPTDIYIIIKTVFKDSHYSFSEVLGKTDNYLDAVRLSDIDKLKYAEVYKYNGWTAKYLINRID